jgi:hypothetical protein
MAEPKKCAHPPCVCMAQKGSKYCGTFCEEAGKDDVEISCDCGHPGCGLE